MEPRWDNRSVTEILPAEISAVTMPKRDKRKSESEVEQQPEQK